MAANVFLINVVSQLSLSCRFASTITLMVSSAAIRWIYHSNESLFWVMCAMCSACVVCTLSMLQNDSQSTVFFFEFREMRTGCNESDWKRRRIETSRGPELRRSQSNSCFVRPQIEFNNDILDSTEEMTVNLGEMQANLEFSILSQICRCESNKRGQQRELSLVAHYEYNTNTKKSVCLLS